MRQQGERPDQPADQRAQVVGRVEVGERAAGVGPCRPRGPRCSSVISSGTSAPTSPPIRAVLTASTHVDESDPSRKREHRVQRRRGQATDDAQQRLDGDERDGRVGQQRFDRQGARAQRGDVARDDQRGGDDAAAVQTRRQRQQGQFVDDAAGRARRDGGQQQRPATVPKTRWTGAASCVVVI